MTNSVTHMAATSAAMRMLLARDPLTKPADLLIGASNELTTPLIEMMMAHAAHQRTTFLVIFQVEGDLALLEKVIVVDGSTEKNQINIGAGKFVQRADGRFAIRSLNNARPYEYTFSRDGRRLQRRPVKHGGDEAMMELRGLQALLAKAETPLCQAEAVGASVTAC